MYYYYEFYPKCQLWLAIAQHNGGGGCEKGVEMPSPAHSCTRGRWRRREWCRNINSSSILHARVQGRWRRREWCRNVNSSSILHAREVEEVRVVSKRQLQLDLAHEGGGGGGVETSPPARSCMRGRWRQREWCRNINSSSLLHSREEEVRMASKHHLQLALACEGGGGGESGVKNVTSSSLLHAREVEEARLCRNVTSSSNVIETSPPARSCTRGRWRR
jgi:hypothetical protein